MNPIFIKSDFLFMHKGSYEGIFFFIAIVSAIIYFTYLCKQNKIDIDVMYEAIFYGIIAALLIGRLTSLMLWSPKYFFSNPISFFYFSDGGITVAGGVLGGLIAGVIYAKIKKLHFFYHIQFFVPPILIGHIVGRFGCFLNGDASGSPTNLPWGLVYNPNSLAYSITGITPGTHLHPTQLYEIILNLILLVFLLLTENNKWITSRRIIWYAFGYSIIRFIVEIFRTDTEIWFGVFTAGQQICLVGFILAAGMLIWSLKFPDKLEARPENIASIKTKS
jgi:prolipoprotein diacylglyceryl transferase